MERIFHSFEKWEDYPLGFYDNQSGLVQKTAIDNVIFMFNSELLTTQYMIRVINEWILSCEHNLTNESLNKIAYIGQSAACIYCGASFKTTILAWNKLDSETQERANKIALMCLNKWIERNG